MINRLHLSSVHPFKTISLLFYCFVLSLFTSSCTTSPQQNREDFAPELSRKVLIAGTFVGPDGQLLPFAYEDEVLNFLKTAQIQGELSIPAGVTKPKKLLLEKDDVKSHAVFHYRHYISRRETLKDGQVVLHFRDSYLNQVAAYEMSRLLCMSNIPPTVLRNADDKEGSVQMWIENAINEKDRIDEKRSPPDRSIMDLAVHDMRVFDNLINNIDRNLTNILYGPDWKLWLIDHTRAFGRNKELPDPKRLRRCSRFLWEQLQSLDSRLVKEKLRPYMDSMEIASLFDRRDKIIKFFKEKIEKEGEDNILFEYPKP